MNKQFKGMLALAAMVIVGTVLVALFGELGKHFIAPDTLYFSAIDHVYLLAAAALLLWIGLGRFGLSSIRNLTGFFVLERARQAQGRADGREQEQLNVSPDVSDIKNYQCTPNINRLRAIDPCKGGAE